MKIRDVMTRAPQEIESSAPLTEAMALMSRSGVRHLPVLKEGALVGVVSDRDLKFSLRFPVPSDSIVEHIMTRNPYVVAADTDLSEVVSVMADRRYGSVIVVEAEQASSGRGQVVGIFTTTDALKVLGSLLRRREKAA